jgi:flagellar protein FliT
MWAPELELYENIATTTQRMVDAARAHDWDALHAAERECLHLVQRAGALGTVALDAGARRRKAQLMLTMLRNDAELRALAHPDLARLEALLGLPPAAHAEGATPDSAAPMPRPGKRC